MTFFANAGVKWPNLDTQLRDAGSIALSAGVDFWRLVKSLEGMEREYPIMHRQRFESESARDVCCDALDEAAELYSNIIDRVDDRKVFPTENEISEAATDFSVDSVSKYSSRDLYKELRDKLLSFAGTLQELPLDGRRSDPRHLAPEIFKAMQQWEEIARIARLTSVVNQRVAVRAA